jgi:hypothetical protein
MGLIYGWARARSPGPLLANVNLYRLNPLPDLQGAGLQIWADGNFFLAVRTVRED